MNNQGGHASVASDRRVGTVEAAEGHGQRARQRVDRPRLPDHLSFEKALDAV